jgi:hypothetical protein
VQLELELELEGVFRQGYRLAGQKQARFLLLLNAMHNNQQPTKETDKQTSTMAS